MTRLPAIAISLLQAAAPAAEPAKTAYADSAKAKVTEALTLLHDQPGKFFSELLQDSLNFGVKLLLAILLYIIGAWIIKKVKRALEKSFSRKEADKTLATFITSLVTITLTILLIVIVIGTLGINTSSFAALLAAGGMAIGMALSGTVQNFAGGVMILLFKPFKIGDYIKAQNYEGYVVDLNIVSTKIRTYANSIIILPNGTLFNGTIDNFTDKPYHRVSWSVDVPYGTDVDKARSVISDVLKAEERIIRDGKVQGVPDPSIYVGSLKDSSVSITVWAWVKVEDYWPVQFKINEEIYKALPEKGIEFPFPQLDVHVSNIPAQDGKA